MNPKWVVGDEYNEVDVMLNSVSRIIEPSDNNILTKNIFHRCMLLINSPKFQNLYIYMRVRVYMCVCVYFESALFSRTYLKVIH